MDRIKMNPNKYPKWMYVWNGKFENEKRLVLSKLHLNVERPYLAVSVGEEDNYLDGKTTDVTYWENAKDLDFKEQKKALEIIEPFDIISYKIEKRLNEFLNKTHLLSSISPNNIIDPIVNSFNNKFEELSNKLISLENSLNSIKEEELNNNGFRRRQDDTRELKLIRDMSISQRLRTALIYLDMLDCDIDYFVNVSRANFLRVRNVGKKTLKELEDLLAEEGVYLKD